MGTDNSLAHVDRTLYGVNLLVVSEASPGNEAHLVVRCEYSTAFENL